ncbi:MAG TPA: amidohydrolase family protein [Bryobacteraceae bacterium]|nr:amidohydrolase family protein [Bryobacteraceae bacterium]
MRTPWGELAVSDAHVHFFSYRFFQMLAAQRRVAAEEQTVEAAGAVLGWEMPPPEPESLARRWVQELERHGVSRAALIASLPGDEDSVAAAVAAFPERFYGYFMVDPCAPEALARVQRALAGGYLRGVCLFPAMHRYSLHDERVTALLEVAAAHPGTVVFIHCGVLTVGVRKRLGLPSLFDLRYSNPVDVHALALRYPNLSFVIPHFGAGYFREALMVADLCPNVHLDTSSSNSWLRYLAPETDLKAVFRRALDVAGPRRLLFGTDSSFFPRGWQRDIFETQAQILYDLGVLREDAALIFGENLERIFTKNRAG